MSSTLLLTWFYFLICVVTIGFSGTRLTRYGDGIADKTGLGGTWVGILLLATVTSLPELAAGISSVLLVDVPNVAVGNIFGACAYNLLILVFLDYLDRDKPLYVHARRGHILSAGFGIVLLAFTSWNLMLGQYGMQWAVWQVGIYSPLIILLYVFAMRTIFAHEKAHIAAFTEKEPDKYPELSLQQLVVRYCIAAAFVVAAGTWLPYVAEDIAAQMGWTESFVGTLFVPLVTSLPELVVTYTAARIGAVDMAIGDLLGSNLFNITILAIDDLFYRPADLLSAVSRVHLISAITAIGMTGIVIAGLYYRSQLQLFRRFGWTSMFLLLAYLVNAVALYQHDHGVGKRDLDTVHASLQQE